MSKIDVNMPRIEACQPESSKKFNVDTTNHSKMLWLSINEPKTAFRPRLQVIALSVRLELITRCSLLSHKGKEVTYVVLAKGN